MLKTIADWGENALIHWIRKEIADGIGDDCAWLPYPPRTVSSKKCQLVTHDQLIENVHFKIKWTTAHDLGRKSATVNLSDIAASGGSPQYLIVGVGFPANTSVKWIQDFFYGLKEVCDEYGVKIVGGDTTLSQNIVIGITAIGEQGTRLISRDGAKAGDLIVVSGPLGCSGLGLEIAQKKGLAKKHKKFLKNHHDPKAKINEGHWLATQKSVRAMMDLSDGLVTDLERMSQASQFGFRVSLDLIPMDKDFIGYFKGDLTRCANHAASWGEDYELLVAVQRDGFADLAQAYFETFGTELFVVGEFLKSKTSEWYLTGKKTKAPNQQYFHFGKKNKEKLYE